MSEPVFKTRGGKSYSAAECPVDVLQWYANNARDDGMRDAAIEELSRRPEEATPSGQPAKRQPQSQQQSTALATVPREQMLFALTDVEAVNARIKSIKSQVILLTPAPVVTSIPDGHSIESTMVTTDPSRDFWNISGNQFLKGYKVNELSVALNVSWNRTLREDYDNSVLNVWVFTVSGTVQGFDGSLRTITGTYELDLRDGSEAAKTLKPGDLANKRKAGLRLAESGAKFRAICSGCALQRTVPKEDLDKPFVILRLKLTGDYADPELRRDYSRMLAARALGVAVPALYPSTQPQPAALPPSSTLDVPPEEDDPFGPNGEAAQ